MLEVSKALGSGNGCHRKGNTGSKHLWSAPGSQDVKPLGSKDSRMGFGLRTYFPNTILFMVFRT